MPEIAPRKLVTEVRFKPRLMFHSQMDQVATAVQSEFVNQFADWSRSAVTLELQNRSRNFRLRLEFNRVFFESDGSIKESKEIETLSRNVLRFVLQRLEVPSLTRVGCRRWYAIQIGTRQEGTLIQKLLDYFTPRSKVEDLIGKRVSDVAYTFEHKHEESRTHVRVVMGAMKKEQWKMYTPYAAPSDLAHLNQLAMSKIIEDLPSDFVFLDSDSAEHDGNGTAPLSVESALSVCERSEEELHATIRRVISIFE